MEEYTYTSRGCSRSQEKWDLHRNRIRFILYTVTTFYTISLLELPPPLILNLILIILIIIMTAECGSVVCTALSIGIRWRGEKAPRAESPEQLHWLCFDWAPSSGCASTAWPRGSFRWWLGRSQSCRTRWNRCRPGGRWSGTSAGRSGRPSARLAYLVCRTSGRTCGPRSGNWTAQRSRCPSSCRTERFPPRQSRWTGRPPANRVLRRNSNCTRCSAGRLRGSSACESSRTGAGCCCIEKRTAGRTPGHRNWFQSLEGEIGY